MIILNILLISEKVKTNKSKLIKKYFIHLNFLKIKQQYLKTFIFNYENFFLNFTFFKIFLYFY